MKKTIKKLVACLIAVLMVLSSMPFTALADDTSSTSSYTLKMDKAGVIYHTSSNSRIDTDAKKMTIVNDCQDSSFSIGFFQYDLTELSSMGSVTAETASMSIAVPAAPLGDCQGLAFYYVTNTNADSLTAGAVTTVTDIYGQGDGTHQAQAVTYYGLQQFATVSAADLTEGATITLSPTQAINGALNQGLDDLTIMVMQYTAGGSSSTDGWTDTYLTYGNNDISATISIDTSDTDTGLTALNNAITAYEDKMALINNGTITVYKNMANAYEAYTKACRYRDAYEYGGDAVTSDELATVTSDLKAKTALMTAWSDTVTGNYGSDKNSKIPSFTNTSTSDMQNYKDFYGNILYTESCTSGNDGTTTGESSGASVIFDTVANTTVQVYYPNTILLYDGSSMPTIPVMFMARKTVNKTRVAYTVYPAVSGASDTYTSSQPGNDTLQSLSYINGNAEYDWKGKDGNNTLDFDYGRGSGSSYVGSSSGNPNKRYSNSFGYAWGSGYWNAYATGFAIKSIDFGGEGVTTVGNYWAWYGGSTASTTNSQGIDSSMRGYKASSHKIYVINYQGFAAAIKNTTSLGYLKNVSNYKEGGLLSLLQAYDTATALDVTSATLSNVTSIGTTIKNSITNLAKKPTQDSSLTAYTTLKTAMTKAKKVYEKGNADNANYTAESWAPFATAYEAAQSHFAGLKTNAFSSSTAATLASPITTAQQALVVNKEVVDSTILQYAIDNADALENNARYFNSIPSNLAEVVEAAKVAVWGSVDNYGLDSEKLVKTTANQAIVDNYSDQLVALVKQASINVDSIVPTYSYSMTTALQAAATYESKKENYSNYSALLNAVNNAKAFEADLPVINAKVEDQVQSVIDTYTSDVDAIGYAIQTLRPSFTNLENGTIANEGESVTTTIYSEARSDQYHFYWTHTSDLVYFKTTRDALSKTLPVSEWGSYNAQTGSNFDSLLDSINLNAKDVDTAELTSQSASFLNTVSGYGLSQTQKDEHPGNLSIQNSNVTLTLNNFKVKTSTGQALGNDASGNNISDSSYDFTDLLSVTNGLEPRAGGVFALGGTTVISSTATVSVGATTGSCTSAENLPSVKSKQMDLAGSGTQLGITYFWRYAPTLMQNWAGYSFDKTTLQLTVGFVDVSLLFELIDTLEADDFQATANNYTTTSWNALTDAIAKAKDDMDYANMSYQQIVDECDTRYTNLLAAKNALATPASNAKLKAAVQAAKSAYENDQAKVDPSTWDAFATAYETALSKYQGIYSDTGVRDYAKSEQSTIDAFATALTNAQDALAYLVDFSVVDNAVVELVSNIENNKYTATSVEALKTAITKLTYYNMDATERAKHYDNETAFVAGLNKEAEETIPGLANDLVVATVDDSALEAAKAAGRSTLSDPDAYDQDSINTALNALSATETVTVMSKGITCYKYDTQEELDADVTEALSGITTQQYVVKINGENYGVYDYGTEITVPAPNDANVDWYYYSKSNTSETATKYFSTGTTVTFVVKGNTNLTAKEANEADDQVKVTYMNGVNSRVVDVAYLTKGDKLELDPSTAAPLAYYSFSGFKIGSTTYSSTEKSEVEINEDTYVILTYDFQPAQDNTFKVFVADLSYGVEETNFSVDAYYNDELAFTRDGYKDGDVNYTKNGETVTVEGAGRAIEDFDSPEVYAWVEVGSNDLATLQAWFDKSVNYEIIDSNGDFTTEAATSTLGKVVAYGTDYSFRVHENVALLALDENRYNAGIAAGVIEDTGNEDGARVQTQSDLVITEGTKFSIISTFTLPDNCELVETGILFAANKDGAVSEDATFTLGNVGSNGVVRAKSTVHTTGNQYVISVKSTALSGKTVGDVGMKWAAYMTYLDESGERVTVYSDVTSPTNDSTVSF